VIIDTTEAMAAADALSKEIDAFVVQAQAIIAQHELLLRAALLEAQSRSGYMAALVRAKAAGVTSQARIQIPRDCVSVPVAVGAVPYGTLYGFQDIP
jgi:uncharacterized protein (DUF1778 family)